MDDMQEIINNLSFELKRGTQVLSVLSQLSIPMYGYSLVEQLKEKGIDIEPGTLYPLLRRIEKQGLLESQWETTTNKPRKYYVLSKQGIEVYKRLCEQWEEIKLSMDNLLQERK